MSVQYLATIRNAVDIPILSQDNEFETRREVLIELLRKYAFIVSNRNTTSALEKRWLTRLRYKQFLEDFDKFIEETIEKHEEKGWFNPFLNRHYYNALRWAPVFLIGQYISNLEDLKQTCLEETPIFIYNQTLFDKLLKEAKEENTPEAFRVYLHLEGSRKYRDELTLLSSALVEQRYQIYTEFKTQGENWKTSTDENKAYQNLRYEAMLCDFICDLYHEPRIHQVLNDRERITPISLFGETLSGIPYYLYLLENSTNLYELLYASYSLKKYPLEEIFKFTDKTAYSALYVRFEAYTGVPFDVNINCLYTEVSTSLIGSAALSEDGLLATVKSEPTVRWIRTLNGEIYVSRSRGVANSVGGVDEVSGEKNPVEEGREPISQEVPERESETEGKITTCADDAEGACGTPVQIGTMQRTGRGTQTETGDIEKETETLNEEENPHPGTTSADREDEGILSYRFFRTSTGVENKYQLLESISRYGKEEAQIEGLIYTEDGYVTMQQYQKTLKKLEGMHNTHLGKSGYVGQEVFDDYTKQQEEIAKSHSEAVIQKWKTRVDKPVTKEDYYYAKLSHETKEKETLQTGVKEEGTQDPSGTDSGIGSVSSPTDTDKESLTETTND